MALNFEDEETDRLAREVADRRNVDGRRPARSRRETGARMFAPRRSPGLADRLLAIGEHCASLPDLDPRAPDEIVGYDESGMWR